MEEQKINKKIIISIVAVLLIVLITIGATYAYFSAQAETGTQTVTTGTLTMDFDKTGSVVTIDGITPINDSEIKTKAAAFPFSITNTGTVHMKLTIKLKDIVIADDLKDIDFRWGLYNADTELGVSFGIFKNVVTGGEEILLRDVILDSGSETKNYILRIWIHDDGALQNEMQGETFSGKVTVTGEAIEYTPESCFETDGAGTITGYDSSGICDPGEGDLDVVIPRTIGDEEITFIGQSAFDTFGISSVIIPDSVIEIEDSAFQGNGLNHITIPDSVTYIRNMALDDNNFSSITIPESVTTFEENTIRGNYTGSTGCIVIPGNIKIVPGFDGVGDIVLMEGITTIQSDSFWDLSTNETSIEIPSSVTYIGEMPFLHSSFDEIIVRGKSSAPSEFSTDWDCVATSSGETYDKCTKYANVEYRP